MVSFLNLMVLGATVLAVAHGASLATAADERRNCTMSDSFQAITCLFRMNDFIEKIDELDMDNKEEVKEFKRSCDSLQTCLSALNCRPKNDKESFEVSGMIKSYCDAVVYVSVDFADCGEKLEAKNSTCFEKWEPFPEQLLEEKDAKKKEELAKEACKNFFGKDNCLKKEIAETCSEEEWNNFRDHFLSLNAIMKQCTF